MASEYKPLILSMENALIAYATFIYIQRTVAVGATRTARGATRAAYEAANEAARAAYDAARAAYDAARAAEAEAADDTNDAASKAALRALTALEATALEAADPQTLKGLFNAILELDQLDNQNKCNIVSRHAWYIEILLKYDSANDDAINAVNDAAINAANDPANDPATSAATNKALNELKGSKNITDWINIRSIYLRLAKPDENSEWIQKYIQEPVQEPEPDNSFILPTIIGITGALIGIGGTLLHLRTIKPPIYIS
jgi:hypothetical protein